MSSNFKERVRTGALGVSILVIAIAGTTFESVISKVVLRRERCYFVVRLGFFSTLLCRIKVFAANFSAKPFHPTRRDAATSSSQTIHYTIVGTLTLPITRREDTFWV